MRSACTSIAICLGFALAAPSSVALGQEGAGYVRYIHPDKLELVGEIDTELLISFGVEMKRHPGITKVTLRSPGGKVYPALMIADLVHKGGLSTEVPSAEICASACALIFMAGNARKVSGYLGVHQVYGVNDPSVTQTTISDLYATLANYNVHPRFIELMLRTPPSEMYWFSEDELSDYGINSPGKPTEPVSIEKSNTVILKQVSSIGFKDWSIQRWVNVNSGYEFFSLGSRTFNPVLRFVWYPHNQREFLELLWEIPIFTEADAEEIEFRFIKTGYDSYSLYPHMRRAANGYDFNLLMNSFGNDGKFWGAIIEANWLEIYDSSGSMLTRLSLAGSKAAYYAFQELRR